MEQVPGKAVDDAEAEAVLLALSEPVLRWSAVGFNDKGQRVKSDIAQAQSGCFYRVFLKKRWGFAWYCAEHRGIPTEIFGAYPQKLKTEAAAKAACERHHETGKWDRPCRKRKPRC